MKKLISLALVLIMIFALASCGGKDEDTKETKNDVETSENVETKEDEANDTAAQTKGEADDTTAETKEDEKETKEEDSDNPFLYTDFYEDDEKITIKLTEQMTYVFYHDGENITRFVTYMDCGSEEEAESFKNLYKLADAEAENPTYKDVSTDGSFVIIESFEKDFPYQTYEEVTRYIELLKVAMTAQN